MSNPRLIPFVDIPYHAKARQHLKRSLEHHQSSSTLPSPEDLSPLKRRKLPQTQTAKEGTPANAIESISIKSLRGSPTASDFEFGSDSNGDPDLPDTRSPSFPDVETDGSQSANAGDSEKARALDELPLHIYNSTEDEIDEDEDLVVFGESLQDDDDETVPVRILDNFTVYDSDTKQLVSIAELLQLEYSPRKYRASGIVRPWVNLESDGSDIEDELDSNGNDDDSEEAAFRSERRDQVTLSNILEFNLHAESESLKHRIDPKLYIRTRFAWYILAIPSHVYKAFFTPFWLKHHFLHLLIIASMDNARITYPQFIEKLSTIEESAQFVAASEVVLGRGLKPEDLESDEVLTYVMSNLPDVCANIGIKISRVPLIREILGATHYEFDTAIPDMRSSPESHSLAPKSKWGSNQTKATPAARAQQNKTFLTEVVNEIAKNFFAGSLEVAQSALNLDNDDFMDIPHHKGHYSNPDQIIWGKELGKHQGVYETATIDGVLYSIGEVVMVAPDIRDSSTPYSVNKYANKWWFCQIRYFFEEKSPKGTMKMFHGLWFSHGSKTLLQETSHSKALYLLNNCDNNAVTTIFKKCNMRIMQSGADEVIDDGSHVSNDFHCGLLYDADSATFMDLPANALDVEKEEKSCFACDLHQEHSNDQGKHLNGDTLILHGVAYHIDECVYIIPSGNTSKLLEIGQIISISEQEVHVYLLGRYDDYVYQQKKLGADNGQLVFDEKRLFLTNQKQAVSQHRLDGICYVKYFKHVQKVKDWTQYDDHYYLCQKGDIHCLDIMPQKDFSFCETCYSEDQKRKKSAEIFSQTNSKLVGLELFSGAGGLGVGMNLSGFVETKYAVEFSPSAAKTYVKNHPETTVYCQDSSALLKHAVTGSTGKGKTAALLSLDGKTYCPPLPSKNVQIDFIFGGPPCQSFSHANHSKRQDDIRSTMPCNMLSYVEYYSPTYFLLENVAGFLSHKFYSTRQTESGAVLETEIQMGMVKFVMRTLIALGYQVRFRLLQAAQYGVPQSRRRVIFWGAKRGVPLPTFPVPMYAYEKGMHRVNLPTGDVLEPQTRSKNPEVCHQYAPLRPITVDAAIGDLPQFDWTNPHHILPATKQTRREDVHRRDVLDIPSFHAVYGDDKKKTMWSSLPGFSAGALYFTEPQNRFQEWVRQDMENEDGEEKKVSGQYTTRFNSRVVEATCTVPLKPGACHRDLPQSLLPGYAMKKKNRVFYGRMDGDGFFRCIVTQLSPLLKNQWPLHPSQKRIITVRESARCQGFPDRYEFESVDDRPAKIIEDQLRQIGNAVAVPFALALGKELGKAMILAWEKKQREGSVPL